MEVPALLTFPVIYFFGTRHHFVGQIVVALWVAHYTHRALIWLWIVPRRDSKMRVMLCVSGIVFNVLNGGLWGWFMGYIADYANDWVTDPRFVIGMTLAISGGALNIWSDYRLWRLRMDKRWQIRHSPWRCFQSRVMPQSAGRNTRMDRLRAVELVATGPRVCPMDDCKHGAEGTLAPRLVSRDI